MKKALLTTALVFAISVPVFACGGPGKLLAELDLTEQQISQLKELRQEKRETRKAFKAERAAMNERKQALMENYTDSEAQAFAAEVGEKAKQRTLSKLHSMQEIMAILTSEQQIAFKKLMAEHGDDHRHGGRGRHGAFF